MAEKMREGTQGHSNSCLLKKREEVSRVGYRTPVGRASVKRPCPECHLPLIHLILLSTL